MRATTLLLVCLVAVEAQVSWRYKSPKKLLKTAFVVNFVPSYGKVRQQLAP